MQPSSPNTELAKERNRAAAERTLMAWIRTSLALITFGFGIDRLVLSLREGDLAVAGTWDLSRVFALSFIALGIAAAIMAMFEHRGVLAALRTPGFRYEPRFSLAFLVGAGLVAIGGLVFVGVLFRL